MIPTIQVLAGKAIGSVVLKISDDITTTYYQCADTLQVGICVEHALKMFGDQKTREMLQYWTQSSYEQPY